MAMFHMANDSNLFKTKVELDCEGYELNGNCFLGHKEQFSPLYEAKMIYSYNHRHGDFRDVSHGQRVHVLPEVPLSRLQDAAYVTLPYYWVPEKDVTRLLAEKSWAHQWLLGWRDVTDARASARTLKAAIIPRAAVGDGFLLMMPDVTPQIVPTLVANLSAIICDYVARQKVGGLHMKYFTMKQLPILPPTAYATADIDFIAPRVLELVYTATDLQPFAEDMGYQGKPFLWDDERRAHLRAELDAYYAKLYGLTRDELRYVLDPQDVYGEDFPGETFRVLKEKEIRLYGEYRTRRLVLEKWDQMFGG